MDKLLKIITIYHKENNKWIRYNEKASVRNTASFDRNTNGVQSNDNALIRIFNVEGYNKSYKIQRGDVVYSGDTKYEIEKAPITELQKLYGKDKVFEVSSIEEFIFDDEDLKEINHIKVGGR